MLLIIITLYFLASRSLSNGGYGNRRFTLIEQILVSITILTSPPFPPPTSPPGGGYPPSPHPNSSRFLAFDQGIGAPLSPTPPPSPPPSFPTFGTGAPPSPFPTPPPSPTLPQSPPPSFPAFGTGALPLILYATPFLGFSFTSYTTMPSLLRHSWNLVTTLFSCPTLMSYLGPLIVFPLTWDLC
ncbi:hypothetical protein M5689_013216 [Euphorbia peplus]|nr:hypothetical protein M5689_013216 [Euphorbia peplus]